MNMAIEILVELGNDGVPAWLEAALLRKTSATS
jgi:hypothetical protein